MTPNAATGQGLLVMHAQPPITAMVEDTTWLTNIASAIAAARSADIPVIYIAIGFRKGHPEVVPGTYLAEQLSGTGAFIKNVSNAFHPSIAPEEDDVTIDTSRISAFSGTELSRVLRAKRIDHLVLTGISTGGVVLGTALSALDRDLKVTILNDAVTDASPQTHDAVLQHLAAGTPWKARVIQTREWIRQDAAVMSARPA
jgi:nicotinamidase-related amidase